MARDLALPPGAPPGAGATTALSCVRARLPALCCCVVRMQRRRAAGVQHRARPQAHPPTAPGIARAHLSECTCPPRTAACR